MYLSVYLSRDDGKSRQRYRQTAAGSVWRTILLLYFFLTFILLSIFNLLCSDSLLVQNSDLRLSSKGQEFEMSEFPIVRFMRVETDYNLLAITCCDLDFLL